MTFTKEQAYALVRVQIAMFLPASCVECGRDYVDVDDFLARNPRAGDPLFVDGVPNFVDDACWPAYITAHPDIEVES